MRASGSAGTAGVSALRPYLQGLPSCPVLAWCSVAALWSWVLANYLCAANMVLAPVLAAVLLMELLQSILSG
jgi:hypothetical protein